MTITNYSTAVFLINDDVRLIEAAYEVDKDDKPVGNTALFKTLDKKLAVGDFIVVPTDSRHKMTVFKVVAVDLDVDFASTKEVKWVLGKIDLADANEIKKQEDEALTAIKSAQKRKAREELQAALLKDAQAARESLKALPIASASVIQSPAVVDDTAKG